MMPSGFAPGSLVRARGRDWIVLPSHDDGVLRLRPLTRAQAAEVGIYLPLEGKQITSADFAPPPATKPGDATGVMTLFNAARLSLRSGAAPFRSLGRISVTPRPYQFVPLIMALRLDPVRLLIADDVGVGKTIEAAMIARELLDRGVAKRLAVLCPAHLCDQWERELREKFEIESALVQPSQIARLERERARQDVSIYGYYPNLVASIDFVKSERGAHRDAFLRDAPDLIIVDEAHIAARPRGTGGQIEHQRYELLRDLAKDGSRNLILVTATPHSGIEESFRPLLGLLDPELESEADRKKLLPHVIQRRRQDVEKWLGSDTPFPQRKSEERHYELGAEYLKLFSDVLDYCRETVEAGSHLRAAQQRVRHWAAIAILRCLLSSPTAAATVLDARADRMAEAGAGEETQDEIDRAYSPQVLDVLGDEEVGDYTPTGPLEDPGGDWTDSERRRLLRFRDAARDLAGPKADRKLQALTDTLRDLLKEGYNPIVFCRFIQTANYLERWLSAALTNVHVWAVTGEIDDEQRRERVAELSRSTPRILVATDCLSEGINLQEHFNAVVHYDLPWNPNRLEQREGRVDRFGQPRGGSLAPAKSKDGVFTLSAGSLKPKLQEFAGGGFPIAVTFDRGKDTDALYLGRTQPMVAGLCDAVLGEAFAIEGEDRFARAGAMFTDAVARWTALLLLRFRYRLIEDAEEFAEEIVLAAFERHANGPSWLEPYATAGRELADRGLPKANISREERSSHVGRALHILEEDPAWFRPILNWRVSFRWPFTGFMEASIWSERWLGKRVSCRYHPGMTTGASAKHGLCLGIGVRSYRARGTKRTGRSIGPRQKLRSCWSPSARSFWLASTSDLARCSPRPLAISGSLRQ